MTFGEVMALTITASGGKLFTTDNRLFVDRSVCRVAPEPRSDLQPMEFRRKNDANMVHWANFLDCIRTRKKPTCDIELGCRSTSTAILGNVAYRSKLRLDWDGRTVRQAEARRFLSREGRKPWTLVV